MQRSLEDIAAQAMKLPPGDRFALAERLQLSVHEHGEIDAAWDAEIQRRIAQLDAGEAECVPWETVIADRRAQLKRDA